MSIIDVLRRFLLKEIAVDSDRESLTLDEDLLVQGIIDSMGILKLVSFIESEFDIDLSDEDIIPDNFRTLNSLNEFIESKIRR